MEERKQKTKESYPREDRLEAEVIEGAQTYMEMTEGRLAEVQIDEKHLMELILSPYNMNRAYRKVVSNGGSGGVDSMEANDLLPYLKLHNDELRNSILNGKYKPMPVCAGWKSRKTMARRANWVFQPWWTASSNRV